MAYLHFALVAGAWKRPSNIKLTKKENVARMTYAEGIHQKGGNSVASIAVAETKFLLDLHNSIRGKNYFALLAVYCPSPVIATAPKFPGIAPPSTV